MASTYDPVPASECWFAGDGIARLKMRVRDREAALYVPYVAGGVAGEAPGAETGGVTGEEACGVTAVDAGGAAGAADGGLDGA
jgi:hypothetical protein